MRSRRSDHGRPDSHPIGDPMNAHTKMGKLPFLLLSLSLSGCAHAPPQKGQQIPEGMSVKDAYGDVIALDQGWTGQTQQAYYNTPQGAEIMPYAWILALEQKDRTDAFLAPAHIESYRYLPRKKSS